MEKEVTPRAGVWIEIAVVEAVLRSGQVTPRAGVWIEIPLPDADLIPPWSLPVRECGLK